MAGLAALSTALEGCRDCGFSEVRDVFGRAERAAGAADFSETVTVAGGAGTG